MSKGKLEQFNDWMHTATRYILLGNAGGAVATLSFLGTAMAKGVMFKFAIIPLACFVVGIVVGSLAILGQLTAAWVAWVQEDIPGAEPERGSWVTRLGAWVEPRTGKVLFWAFACFALGALIGIVALVAA